MGKFKYEYSVDEERFEFESVFDEEDIGWLAEGAAEDYHCNHDGWEASWPITFEIFRGGESLGSVEVEREVEPVFNARIV